MTLPVEWLRGLANALNAMPGHSLSPISANHQLVTYIYLWGTFIT